jgi:hypothetical protein
MLSRRNITQTLQITTLHRDPTMTGLMVDVRRIGDVIDYMIVHVDIPIPCKSRCHNAFTCDVCIYSNHTRIN